MTEPSAPGGQSSQPPRPDVVAPSEPAAAAAKDAQKLAAVQPAPQPAPPANPTPQAPAGENPGMAASTKPGIKTRFPYQRSCNEKDEKGKLCAGHLKRWYGFGDDIRRKYGENAEVYRCEYCHTIYLPAPGYPSRSGTMQF